MKDLEIIEEVLLRSKDDFWCQECLAQIEKYKEAFLSIRSRLTEAEQEQLDLYIGACEAWCDAHIFVAYQLGREDPFQIL